MNLTYAHQRRIKSLATRYLRAYDDLEENKELNEIYRSDFVSYVEKLLEDLLGLKKQEPVKETYQRRKVGSRPSRKPGERPPKIGEEIKNNKSSDLAVYEEIEQAASVTINPDQPDWYKKAWRKVMMAVHPDRVNIVSESEKDKLARLQIGEKLRQDESNCLLIAACNVLNIEVDLTITEQEKELRVSLLAIQKETASIHQSVQWIWGETMIDNNVRIQIIKNVLSNSGISPPDDLVILEHLTKNFVY